MDATTTTIDPKKAAAGAARVDTAAARAYDLIQRYAEVPDPYSDADDNPWRNPHAMFEEMKVARGELVAAWNEMNQQRDASGSEQDEEEQKQQDEDFRAAYMDMITDAFADVLEDMRNNETEEIDVDVLVDCLQSGFDLLSVQDKEIFFQGIDDDDEDEFNGDGDSNIMTPHERRRIELGFDVQVSS